MAEGKLIGRADVEVEVEFGEEPVDSVGCEDVEVHNALGRDLSFFYCIFIRRPACGPGNRSRSRDYRPGEGGAIRVLLK